jgi:ABC-type phosphate transport system substrate-binding protein
MKNTFIFLCLLVVTQLLIQHTIQFDAIVASAGGSLTSQKVHSQLTLVYENYVDFVYKFNFTVTDEATARTKLQNNQFNYILSESRLTTVEKNTQVDWKSFPLFAFGIGIIHNVQVVNSTAKLVLDRATLTDIFAGNITNWSDSRIKALHPAATVFPDEDITIVVRGDNTPITKLFTQALSIFSNTSWSYGFTNSWPKPASDRILYASSESELETIVKNTPNTIGYVVRTTGKTYNEFNMINKAGNTVSNTVDAIESAIQDFTPAFDVYPDIEHIELDLIDGTGATTWPICGFTYVVIDTNTVSGCSLAKATQSLYKYIVGTTAAQAILASSGFTGFITQDISQNILANMECNGDVLSEVSAPTNEFSAAPSLNNNRMSLLLLTVVLFQFVLSHWLLL